MKKKLVLIIVLCLMLVIASSTMVLMLLKAVSLKADEIVYEYGQPLHIEYTSLLDTEDQQILDSLSVDESQIEYEENQTYPKVGKYSIPLHYQSFFKKMTTNLKLIVKDTTSPQFDKSTNEINLFVNDQLDIEASFSCSDLSGCKLLYDTSQVKLNQEGSYPMQIKAVDPYENESIMDFVIHVKSRSVASVGNQVTIVNGLLIVNKKHGIPSDYATTEDPVAKAQIQKLISDMQALGYDISSDYNGYRSYSIQRDLYNSYVSKYGQAKADTFSARPGYSEHQSGLAFDLHHQNRKLVKNENEVQWIAQNAYKYGFIVRYQKGWEAITGYQAEPWHLRYIGSQAEDIYRSGLTLEEYLGVEGGGYR